MLYIDGFKEWLSNNTEYSEKVISDIVSRLKRADGILPWRNEDVYQFYLEREANYAGLTASVRSQCKRAVKLYSKYLEDLKLADDLDRPATAIK